LGGGGYILLDIFYVKIGGSDLQWELRQWMFHRYFLELGSTREVILHEYRLSLAGHIRLHLTIDTIHDRTRYSTFPHTEAHFTVLPHSIHTRHWCILRLYIQSWYLINESLNRYKPHIGRPWRNEIKLIHKSSTSKNTMYMPIFHTHHMSIAKDLSNSELDLGIFNDRLWPFKLFVQCKHCYTSLVLRPQYYQKQYMQRHNYLSGNAQSFF